MAGLPRSTSDLLNDDVLTFLRRADPIELADVDVDEVRSALVETLGAHGRTIEDEALAAAAAATGGYPFMIQLVGYHVWSRSRGHDPITSAHVEAGIVVARRKLGSTVHASALADLSDVDRTYLLAMAQDDGPSRTGEVAKRMKVSPSYASTYRERLISAQIIEAAGHGKVDFAIPYLREYLREHAAHIELGGRLGTSGS